MQPHTIRQFSQKYPAFTGASLRNLVFRAERRYSTAGEIPGNGLIEAGAVVRVGRKVLIDEDSFFAWVRQENGLAGKDVPTPTTVDRPANATAAA